MSELKDILNSKEEDSEKYKLLRSFFSKTNIDFKTELNDAEISAMVVIEYIDKYLDEEYEIKLNLTKDFTNSLKYKKVSHKRKGREEGISVLKAQNLTEDKEKNALQKLLTG